MGGGGSSQRRFKVRDSRVQFEFDRHFDLAGLFELGHHEWVLLPHRTLSKTQQQESDSRQNKQRIGFPTPSSDITGHNVSSRSKQRHEEATSRSTPEDPATEQRQPELRTIGCQERREKKQTHLAEHFADVDDAVAEVVVPSQPIVELKSDPISTAQETSVSIIRIQIKQHMAQRSTAGGMQALLIAVKLNHTDD